MCATLGSSDQQPAAKEYQHRKQASKIVHKSDSYGLLVVCRSELIVAAVEVCCRTVVAPFWPHENSVPRPVAQEVVKRHSVTHEVLRHVGRKPLRIAIPLDPGGRGEPRGY